MDRMGSDLTRNGPVERDIEQVNIPNFVLLVSVKLDSSCALYGYCYDTHNWNSIVHDCPPPPMNKQNFGY